jgi:hypothetical protein
MPTSNFVIVKQYKLNSNRYVFICPHCFKNGKTTVLEQAQEGSKKPIPTKCTVCGKAVDTSGVVFNIVPYSLS